MGFFERIFGGGRSVDVDIASDLQISRVEPAPQDEDLDHRQADFWQALHDLPRTDLGGPPSASVEPSGPPSSSADSLDGH